MNEHRLGIIGGMGPQATNTFYQRIIDRTQAESDQEHLRVLIWSDAKIPDRTAGILGTPDQAEAVYQHLLADAKLLERAGCTVPLPAQLQRVVMSIIYDEIKKGETGSREKFGEIDAYLRQAGCDCAILGCTELSVYRSLHSLPPYYIDAMEILAEQAILRCGKALRNV